MPSRPMQLMKLSIAAVALACLVNTIPGATAQTAPQMAEQVFKNVQVLKGISVADFLGTMGLMSAGIGFDCAECHNNAGTEKVNWAADDNAKKLVARRMVAMVNEINKSNFGGTLAVTCWTCHRGRDRPASVESMETVYGPGPSDPDEIFQQAPGQPQAAQIIDKFIQAVGGDQKLATLTSWVAKGRNTGFGGFGGGGPVQIFAKAPDSHTVRLEYPDAKGRQDSIRSFDGNVGWVQTPLAVVGKYSVSGAELEGMRLDAELCFPGEIKTALRNLRTGFPQTISDLPGPESQTAGRESGGIGTNRVVNVVQGDGPGGLVATLFFDADSGLLLRVLRLSRTPIGRVLTQTDYVEYRDVNGIKMPFRLLFTWLDGRDSIQLDEIQQNVAIPAARFGSPDEVAGK